MTATTFIQAEPSQTIQRPLRIAITGGSGHIGTLLAKHFHAAGHSVAVIARRPATATWTTIRWDGARLAEWWKALDGSDAVINLAGRSVDCRYGAHNRVEIMESRVGTTKLVGAAIQSLAAPPKVWLNASTATIYSHVTDRPMDEATGEQGGTETAVPETWRFSIDVAKRWEEVFFGASTPHTRKIALRSAMTMNPDRGGVFDALLRLVRFRLGGRFGAGDQFVSWIHGRDFVRAIEFLIASDRVEGVVNVAAPNPERNTEFMKSLRKAWGTRVGIPAAQWMSEVGAFFLRTETELILKSRRVVPGTLLRAGFQFDFPEWPAAANDLVRQWRRQRTGEP
jgi:uncharacterized protein (TIGR01777 family)